MVTFESTQVLLVPAVKLPHGLLMGALPLPQVWKLSATDLCEIARNSVTHSGFPHQVGAQVVCGGVAA